MSKPETTIATPIWGERAPLKHFNVSEKDNGWEVMVDCGSFHKEYVFGSTAQAIKALVAFIKTPVQDNTPELAQPMAVPKKKLTVIDDEPEEEEDEEEQQPNALDELIDQGDKPTPLANKTIRIGGLAEGRTIVDEEEDE